MLYGPFSRWPPYKKAESIKPLTACVIQCLNGGNHPHPLKCPLKVLDPAEIIHVV